MTRSKKFQRSTMTCRNVAPIWQNHAHSNCQSMKRLNHQFTFTISWTTFTRTIVATSSRRTPNNSLVQSAQLIKSKILAPLSLPMRTSPLVRSFWMGSQCLQIQMAQLIHVVSSQRVSSPIHTLLPVYRLTKQTLLGSQTFSTSTQTEKQEITQPTSGLMSLTVRNH